MWIRDHCSQQDHGGLFGRNVHPYFQKYQKSLDVQKRFVSPLLYILKVMFRSEALYWIKNNNPLLELIKVVNNLSSIKRKLQSQNYKLKYIVMHFKKTTIFYLVCLWLLKQY